MRKNKSAYRPNALPAKSYSNGDYVESIVSNNKLTKKFKKRKTIVDLCDFCNKEIKVNRVALELRHKQGWRICCASCQNKNKFDLKKDKIWLGEWAYYICK